MEYVKNPSHREMGKGRDLTGLKKDGSLFPIEISLSSYRDKRKTFVIAFIIDISIRKQNERIIIKNNAELEKISAELSILNEDLEKKVEERTINLRLVMSNLEKSQLELKEALSKEKELNEIKSRFVSMASHEFRTPLSTVLSSASLLEKYQLQEEQPKRDKHIKRIKESVRNLNEILEDFLSLGKLDEQKIGATFIEENISDIINQAIEEVEVVKKSSQTIHFTFEGETNCKTDKNLLKNICINILTNAIKFSPEESEIIIRVKNMPEKLKIAVQDQGIGIPKEDLTHLFSTFFRSKNAVNIQGTGLGLHIVKRYLDLLNGEISIESELNKGTQVSIIINKPTNSES
jgi:signal transduction histidine kinase